MQAALVGPGARTAVALGKILGGATLAVVRCLLDRAADRQFSLAGVDWVALVAMLALCSVAMTRRAWRWRGGSTRRQATPLCRSC